MGKFGAAEALCQIKPAQVGLRWHSFLQLQLGLLAHAENAPLVPAEPLSSASA